MAGNITGRVDGSAALDPIDRAEEQLRAPGGPEGFGGQ